MKSAVLSAVLSSAAVAVAASSAHALSVDGGAAAGAEDPLQRVLDGHRVQPGSGTASAEKARAESNSPNRFCDKQLRYRG